MGIREFIPEMLEVDDGALAMASIEFSFIGILPTPEFIAGNGGDTTQHPKTQPPHPSVVILH